MRENPTCEDVTRAVLLFHASPSWGPEQRQEWAEVTGEEEATTRILCDLARRALERGGPGSGAYLDVADALLPESKGPWELVGEARRLREVDRLARSFCDLADQQPMDGELRRRRNALSALAVGAGR